MPNISIVVPEVQQSVLRPVVLDIVRQLEAITKIPKDSVILFPGELNKMYQPGSGIQESDTDRTQFLTNDIVQIEVEEDFHKDSVLSTAVSRQEQLPVFCDDQIGVTIKPVYVTTEISINFKFRSKSKTTIQRWRDDIRMRTSMARDINLHQITYHYLIPGEMQNILYEIHKLRETVEPYGEEFGDYLINNSSTRLTQVSNQSGSIAELGISETQMRIVGYFDFEGYPDKPEHEEENDTWVGTFAYKLTYEKPVACNMSYPVMIHNQILSTKFRPAKQDTYNLDNHLQSYSLSINAFNYFEAQNQIESYVDLNAAITIPDFDEFIPEDIIPGTVNIFNALCQLTSTDKKTLINLTELGDITLDRDIIDFLLQSEWPFIYKTYQSILQVNIYRSMTLMSQEFCTVKSNLDICATNDLNIRQNHRVRFSVVCDLSLLNPDALARLKKFPKALVKILKAVNEGLRNNPGFDDLGNKKYVNKDDIFKFILKPNINSFNSDLDTRSIITCTKADNDYIKSLLNVILSKDPDNREIKDIISTYKNCDYTNLLLRLLALTPRNGFIDNLIRILQTRFIVSNNETSRKTVMTTHVIARDGVRTASVEEYRNQNQ